MYTEWQTTNHEWCPVQHGMVLLWRVHLTRAVYSSTVLLVSWFRACSVNTLCVSSSVYLIMFHKLYTVSALVCTLMEKAINPFKWAHAGQLLSMHWPACSISPQQHNFYQASSCRQTACTLLPNLDCTIHLYGSCWRLVLVLWGDTIVFLL